MGRRVSSASTTTTRSGSHSRRPMRIWTSSWRRWPTSEETNWLHGQRRRNGEGPFEKMSRGSHTCSFGKWKGKRSSKISQGVVRTYGKGLSRRLEGQVDRSGLLREWGWDWGWRRRRTSWSWGWAWSRGGEFWRRSSRKTSQSEAWRGGRWREKWGWRWGERSAAKRSDCGWQAKDQEVASEHGPSKSARLHSSVKDGKSTQWSHQIRQRGVPVWSVRCTSETKGSKTLNYTKALWSREGHWCGRGVHAKSWSKEDHPRLECSRLGNMLSVFGAPAGWRLSREGVDGFSEKLDEDVRIPGDRGGRPRKSSWLDSLRS